MGRISGDRGRRGEQWIERASGGALRRVRNRPRGASMPDFEPWQHPTLAETFVFESKAGAAAVPRKVARAIAQACGYHADAIGVAIFRDLGSTEAVACLPAHVLFRLLGMTPNDQHPRQLLLAKGEP